MNIAPVVVIGPPRSGFSLLITMIQRILDHRQRAFARTPKQQTIMRLMPFFSYVLNKSYAVVFARAGLSNELLFNGEFQLLVGGPKWLVPGKPRMAVRKYIGCRGHGDFLLVTQHPRLLFEYYSIYHSHETPRRWTNEPDYIEHQRFATLRHPLDMLNSAVHSFNALTSEYLQRFIPEADENILRREMALNKLTDLRVCEGLIRHQLKYWREYLDCRRHYAELRWESIIADPVGSLQWVGRQLGLGIEAEEAHAIWAPIDHRNLLTYHQHNYRKDHGILGDWLTHLHPRHIAMARALGLIDIAEALGYGLDDWPACSRSAFQDELDDYLKHEKIAPMQDPVLAGFCFNKSNIDASAFNFKSFPGKQWAYVERSTLTEDALALDVLECAEMGCQRINAIVLTLDASPLANAESLFHQVEAACHALVGDDIAHELLTRSG
ncbi:MAG: sulfotransferase domain-containing protein [Candidatus Competibacteraceae bacterium]|nr:sulfotransferase domain-containing protein [Candidatus Competibacteraceae bacterium]